MTHFSPLAGAAQEEEEEDGGTVDVDAQRQGKAVVLKTTTRQTIFLPVIGLVDGGDTKAFLTSTHSLSQHFPCFFLAPPPPCAQHEGY